MRSRFVLDPNDVVICWSTPSVDKSVYSKLFTSFLSCPVATGYQIAYLLGIEALHLLTTIYGVEDFPSK